MKIRFDLIPSALSVREEIRIVGRVSCAATVRAATLPQLCDRLWFQFSRAPFIRGQRLTTFNVRCSRKLPNSSPSAEIHGWMRKGSQVNSLIFISIATFRTTEGAREKKLSLHRVIQPLTFAVLPLFSLRFTSAWLTCLCFQQVLNRFLPWSNNVLAHQFENFLVWIETYGAKARRAAFCSLGFYLLVVCIIASSILVVIATWAFDAGSPSRSISSKGWWMQTSRKWKEILPVFPRLVNQSDTSNPFEMLGYKLFKSRYLLGGRRREQQNENK